LQIDSEVLRNARQLLASAVTNKAKKLTAMKKENGLKDYTNLAK